MNWKGMREEVGFGVVRVPRPGADPALSASGQSSHCLQRGSSSYGPLVLMGGVAASIWEMGWVWWVLGRIGPRYWLLVSLEKS